jgi:AraC-like DNA-binding protein
MLVLNQSNCQELWWQASQVPPPNIILDEFEEYRAIPIDLGSGYSRRSDLASGIWLESIECEFHRDWLMEVPPHEHLVQSSLYLSGSLSYESGYPTLGEGRSYLSGSGISPGFIPRYTRSQYLALVNIHFQPEAFTEFFTGLTGANAALLKVLVKQQEWKVSFFPQVTLAMRRVAQQMCQVPWRGAMRRLYLQEKVFELLSLQLQPILTDRRLCHSQPGLKPKTIARLYHARELLHSRLENPPILSDVARFVGVSERTLRSGFQELFGMTVVGYLTQQRMQQAERLLRESDRSVAEVANQVGYTNLGHFAAGFRRQFGITPSECLAGKQST